MLTPEKFFRVALILGSLAAAPMSAHGAVLMVLEHTENGQPVETRIDATPGSTLSPIRGRSLAKVRLRAGDTVTSNAPPNEVSVDLLRDNDGQPSLICIVTIRYYRDKNGEWVPHYHILEPGIIGRGKDGRAKILSVPTLSITGGPLMPNPEGFFPSLEFSPVADGTLRIDSWVVR